MVEFTLFKCKDKGGISIKPKNPVNLDLASLKSKFNVIMFTPITMVIDEDGEIIVHNYGELLFKTLKDEAKITEIARRIYG
ncbi:hypothetical protein J4468_01440 [Candidatus Woesearchaeota archaeon]|nr:hypothetical protein [Candidatus Woesearchaeota archaeon]